MAKYQWENLGNKLDEKNTIIEVKVKLELEQGQIRWWQPLNGMGDKNYISK